MFNEISRPKDILNLISIKCNCVFELKFIYPSIQFTNHIHNIKAFSNIWTRKIEIICLLFWLSSNIVYFNK